MPAKQSQTLVFSRCPADEAACIEYSWVPTGRRVMIRLAPGKPIGHRTSQYGLVSHVQIYSLRNGRYGVRGLNLVFPRGPARRGKDLAGAVVHVAGRYAHGYGIYTDGTIGKPVRIPLAPVKWDCGEDPKPKRRPAARYK